MSRKRRERRTQKRREQPRFPRRQEIEAERWRRLYSELNRFRHAFAPAYNHGVAPIIAGVIDYQKKSHARVLVIGGGTGVFSRDLLPAVHLELKKLKNNATIEVFETDISEAVAQAPASAHRIRADIHRLPFGAEVFDLIVGQSMIHQWRMQESIPEIKRVMKQDGCFVHIQDTIPDLKRLAPELGGSPILKAKTRSEGSKIKGVGMEAHKNLVDQIIAHARQNGLNSAAFAVEGNALVGKEHKLGKVGGKNLDSGNAVYYHMGGISVAKEHGIPLGKKKLSYTGIAAIITKQLARPLADYLERIFKK